MSKSVLMNIPYQHLHFDPEQFDSLYNTKRTETELRQFLAFSIAVASKRANQTARAMDRLLAYGPDPFRLVWQYFQSAFANEMYFHGPNANDKLAEWFKSLGFGCHEARSKAFLKLAIALRNQDINLKTCSVDELEDCYGIGPKTARFYLLYSRPNQYLAALDVHVWKVVRDHFSNAPAKVPQLRKQYKYWEAKFLSLLKLPKYSHLTPVTFDFYGWDGKRKGII